jgi:uncharacterized membrane protein YidH (DUF202 family)
MSSEQEILARIRTLLALERNYLSEERTALAEFRTGLTLALVSPPAISLIHFLLEGISNLNFIFPIIIYSVFVLLTIIGIWISVMSRLQLKKIRQKIQLLKERQLKVMRDSDELCDLLEDCITLR